ncbi:MAG: ATPase, T2SS/T4P/T4SS family [Desulfatiglans sp.]|jgi:type II secretory ATPase GspE/PulE/Tfp pilus assembly ATPase PilB-like protein|nr:ATPase, T2SS/T4P/T4SS family [Thermodesulfobacteriota bacterium]MEE4354499.1 ATPase, T2SS/T4P/T4SS family [Desulfatiglans sp.]
MAGIQTKMKEDIDTRIKEAEVYESMGLQKEALAVYEGILPSLSESNSDHKEIIHDRIRAVKGKINSLEKEENMKDISAKDIASLTESFSDEDNPQALFESAFALKELGLHDEAIVEYEKLLQLDFPLEKVIPAIAVCLLKSHSPTKVIEKVEKIIVDQKPGNKEKAQVKFRLGREMEKRDYKDLALELYRSAKQFEPDDQEIKKRLDSIMASLSSGSKYDYLINEKLVTTEQLRKALSMSKKTNKSVEFILLEQFKVRKEELGKSLSFFYNCPFRNYDPDLPIPTELIGNLKKPFLLHELWVPLSWGKNGVEILIDDPANLTKTDHIRALVKTKKINFSVAIKEDIETFIRRFFDPKQQQMMEPTDDDADDFDLIPDVSFEEEEDIEDDREGFDEASGQVVRLVDQIIITAYRKNASDIHIEPSPVTKSTNIRFRIDGVCQEYMKLPNAMARGILSRVKIMAGLDIAERRLPQDGKIKFRRKGVIPFELRAATLPTAGGFEDAVLRILAKAGAMKLEEMALSENNLRIIKQIIKKPYGLIPVVGPTGSGKTTTLHAALGYINDPGRKIWTAEDPVEITQAGLRQVEAKPKIGLDFARIMRSFLRADPDVIMIGEMRDKETASIGVEASLTGHLVLSTLHTNSAPETITRLLDMGLNALNFSDAFLGVLAQRLVRRLCKECREKYVPTEEEFQDIVTDYGRQYFQLTKIEYSPDLVLYRPCGCEACSRTGYKGRLGIHELMEGTPEIKKMIKQQAPTENIRDQALKEGMHTLKQDGILKVFQGITDISEVRRVCIN